MAGRGVGRGRGRGRPADSDASSPGGLSVRNKNEQPATASDESETNGQATLSLRDMKAFIEDSRTYHPQNDVKKVLMVARHFVNAEEDVKTLASLIYNKCLDDYSLAQRGAEICDCLTIIELGNAKFRNCLLSLVQGDYKARQELMASDPGRFRGFITFLCETFNVMRTVNNEVFKPLVNPIFDCFEQILDPEEKGGQSDFEHLNEDICEVFVETLPRVGKLLDSTDDSDRMRELMNKIRTCIIHSKSSPRVRCSLLEVLESYIRGWSAGDSDTARFYCDTAVDIISGLTLS